MMRHLVNLFLFFLPPSRMFGLRRYLLRSVGIDLSVGVSICGRGWIYGRGEVSIGVGSWLSPGVVIHSHLEAPISIGAACDIGPGVEFIPGGHEMGDSSRRAGRGTAKPVAIGDGCWIGAKSIILGGVTVGPGCVVAAGSVLVSDVPPNTLVAGVPARVKRTLPL